MDIALHFDRRKLMDEADNCLSKSLGEWLRHHAFVIPLKMDAVPHVGETLLLLSESGEPIRCLVNERVFNASVIPGKYYTPVDLYVDVLDVESIKSSLLDEKTVLLSSSLLSFLSLQRDSKATALFRVFRAMKIITYADLCQYSSGEIEKVKGIGPTKLAYIEDHLKSVGLSFGMDPARYNVPTCDKIL